jgi:hypothetical protein
VLIDRENTTAFLLDIAVPFSNWGRENYEI